MAAKTAAERNAVLKAMSDSDLNDLRAAIDADKTKPGAAQLYADIKVIQAERRAAKAAERGAAILKQLL